MHASPSIQCKRARRRLDRPGGSFHRPRRASRCVSVRAAAVRWVFATLGTVWMSLAVAGACGPVMGHYQAIDQAKTEAGRKALALKHCIYADLEPLEATARGREECQANRSTIIEALSASNDSAATAHAASCPKATTNAAPSMPKATDAPPKGSLSTSASRNQAPCSIRSRRAKAGRQDLEHSREVARPTDRRCLEVPTAS